MPSDKPTDHIFRPPPDISRYADARSRLADALGHMPERNLIRPGINAGLHARVQTLFEELCQAGTRDTDAINRFDEGVKAALAAHKAALERVDAITKL